MAFDWDAHNARQAEFEKRPLARAEKKNELHEKKAVLEVVGVRNTDTKYGPAWFVDVNTSNEELTLTFPAGVRSFERRELLLAEMADHFNENGAEPIKVRLVKWGTDSDERSAAWGFDPAD